MKRFLITILKKVANQGIGTFIGKSLSSAAFPFFFGYTILKLSFKYSILLGLIIFVFYMLSIFVYYFYKDVKNLLEEFEVLQYKIAKTEKSYNDIADVKQKIMDLYNENESLQATIAKFQEKQQNSELAYIENPKSNEISIPYAEALVKLTYSFSKVHFAHRSSTLSDSQMAVVILMEMCEYLGEAFKIITGHDCDVSFHVTAFGEGELFQAQVRTIAYNKKLKTRVNGDFFNQIHRVFENTPYMEIVSNLIKEDGGEKVDRHFIDNDISLTSKVYKSTYVEKNCYLGPEPFIKSHIVVPILPFGMKMSETSLAGFISLTSQNINAFNKRYDKTILEGVADGIYSLMPNKS